MYFIAKILGALQLFKGRCNEFTDDKYGSDCISKVSTNPKDDGFL